MEIKYGKYEYRRNLCAGAGNFSVTTRAHVLVCIRRTCANEDLVLATSFATGSWHLAPGSPRKLGCPSARGLLLAYLAPALDL